MLSFICVSGRDRSWDYTTISMQILSAPQSLFHEQTRISLVYSGRFSISKSSRISVLLTYSRKSNQIDVPLLFRSCRMSVEQQIRLRRTKRELRAVHIYLLLPGEFMVEVNSQILVLGTIR